MQIIKCHLCGKPIATAIEVSALKKLAKVDIPRYDTLRAKRCSCLNRHTSAFTSRTQPVDLQAYDKFSK